MIAREEDVLQQLLEAAPFESAAEARSALRATLLGLRSILTDDEAAALEQAIDAPWAEPLRAASYQGELTPEEFYRLVAFHERRRLAVGVEHAQVVCRVLSGLLGEEARQRLCRSLPWLTGAFELPAAAEASGGAEHLRAAPAPEHTLAGGRPGSRRPLSEARPTSGRPLSDARPEGAHAHSVARNDDPHSDTKLSSAKGLTQEREGESLARSQRSVRR